MKTSKLTGVSLDWAVAKCRGVHISTVQSHGFLEVHYSKENGGDIYSPSTDWAQGGPIIEREGINLSVVWESGKPSWEAIIDTPESGDTDFHYGKTALVAAMRCYVASKLGDEVEIPNELL